MKEDRWIWISSDSMTCGVSIDKMGIILHTPPILRKFKGQNVKNLIRWMKKQGNFQGTLIK